MFKTGDYIIYSSEGVCQVAAVGHPDLPNADKERLYYTISPVYREGLNYVPVDANVFMRPVISKKQARALIDQMPDIETNACNNATTRELTDHYAAIMKTRACEDLVQLMKTVYSKRQELGKVGKKLGQIDERYMKQAEDMLYGELSVVLDIPREEMPAFISSRIEEVSA